jgi:hypothetical protein
MTSFDCPSHIIQAVLGQCVASWPAVGAGADGSLPVLGIRCGPPGTGTALALDFYDDCAALPPAYSIDCGLSVLAGNTEVVTRESE